MNIDILVVLGLTTCKLVGQPESSRFNSIRSITYLVCEMVHKHPIYFCI